MDFYLLLSRGHFNCETILILFYKVSISVTRNAVRVTLKKISGSPVCVNFVSGCFFFNFLLFADVSLSWILMSDKN